MRRAALFALLAVAAACAASKAKTGAAGPGAAGDSAPELAVLERFELLDDEVEKHRGQCPRLARAIDGWIDGHRGEVEALLEESRARPGLEGARLEEVERHLERIFDRVIDAATTCRGKGGVDQAYARLDGWLEAS